VTTNANKITWTRHPLPAVRGKGTVLYTASGDFEFAGHGEFSIALCGVIGKPYAAWFNSQFIGAYQTPSGAKNAAKRFGTGR
jgi:hypothetical protein